MQYGIVANYCWLLVEGIYLHNLLVLAVFSERSYFTLYLCIGWGEYMNAQALNRMRDEWCNPFLRAKDGRGLIQNCTDSTIYEAKGAMKGQRKEFISHCGGQSL